MAPYILSLVAASVAAALIELLAPRGEGGRMAAQVRMVAGLFLLVALLNPLRVGLKYLTGLGDSVEMGSPSVEPSDYEATLQASVLTLGSAELGAWVKEILASDFSVPPDRVEVIPVWEDSDTLPPPLSELCIVLSGSAMLTDPHPIEAYFSGVLGCPCRVSIAL